MSTWILSYMFLATGFWFAGVYCWGDPPGIWIYLAGGLPFPLLWRWKSIIASGRTIALLAVFILAELYLGGLYWHWQYLDLIRHLRSQGIKTTLADFAQDIPESINAAPALFEWATKHGLKGKYWSKMGPKDQAFSRLSADMRQALLELDGGKVHPHLWGLEATKTLDHLVEKHRAWFAATEASAIPILISRPKFYPVNLRRCAPGDRNEWDLKSDSLRLLPDAFGLIARQRALRGDLSMAWQAAWCELRLSTLKLQDLNGSTMMFLGLSVQAAARTLLSIQANRPAAIMPTYLVDELRSLLDREWIREAFRMELASTLDWHALWRRDCSPLSLEAWTGAGDVGEIKHVRLNYLPLIMGTYPPLIADRSPLSNGRPSSLLYPWYATAEMNLRWDLNQEYEGKTWAKLALLVDALHAYRHRRARYPDQLLDLRDVPRDILIDPFSGVPFDYRRVKGGVGFSLFSVGLCGLHLDGFGRLLGVTDSLPGTGTRPRAPTPPNHGERPAELMRE